MHFFVYIANLNKGDNGNDVDHESSPERPLLIEDENEMENVRTSRKSIEMIPSIAPYSVGYNL